THCIYLYPFFFSSRRRHTRFSRDWSSDVCSSDLVAGLYLAHPDARYFGVGRVGRDQVEDLAARSGTSVAEVEEWLAPNLAYAPRSEERRVGNDGGDRWHQCCSERTARDRVAVARA